MHPEQLLEAVVPALPDVVGRTPLHDVLIPSRVAAALRRDGVQTLSEMQGLRGLDLLRGGVGMVGVSETIETLERLVAIPAYCLEAFTWNGGRSGMPLLPLQVLTQLCGAANAMEEIGALLADCNERDREAVIMRWGLENGAPGTLEEIGARLGITRERVRQIVTRKEQQLRNSGVRLPMACAAVTDLDEVGGALPHRDYEILLRNTPVPVDPRVLALLPTLCNLACVPYITFDVRSSLWTTAEGSKRWIVSGEAAKLVLHARAVAGRHLRGAGAVPVRVLDEISPFGWTHAAVVAGINVGYELVDRFVLPRPARPSALIRACRKTLVATGALALTELHDALRRAALPPLSLTAFRSVLAGCGQFDIRENSVDVRGVPNKDVLSAAEAAGFAELKRSGAMLWPDFLETMMKQGFSAPMAAVVLRKPAVRRIGPATYALRGAEVERSVLLELKRRRSKLYGRTRRNILKVQRFPDGFAVSYKISRGMLQGIVPIPREMGSVPSDWTAQFPDGRSKRLKVKGRLAWSIRPFLQSVEAETGDRLEITFNTVACKASMRHVRRTQRSPTSNIQTSLHDQIAEHLFGYSPDR